MRNINDVQNFVAAVNSVAPHDDVDLSLTIAKALAGMSYEIGVLTEDCTGQQAEAMAKVQELLSLAFEHALVTNK